MPHSQWDPSKDIIGFAQNTQAHLVETKPHGRFQAGHSRKKQKKQRDILPHMSIEKISQEHDHKGS